MKENREIPELTSKEIKNFWKKIIKQDEESCWVWTASTAGFGHGTFRVSGMTFLSHRIAYFLNNGKDPLDKCVLHKCDNPRCCNPNHLFLGTKLDNALDREKKKRGNHVSGDNHGFRLHPEATIKGEKKLGVKLSDEKVLKIRASYKPELGVSYADLAKEYGVGCTTIRSIVIGIKWKHLLPQKISA